MPPKSKSKAKKSKGVDNASKNKNKKAAKRDQAPASLQQDLVDTNTEEVFISDAGPLQGMANNLDDMMTMILELFSKSEWPRSNRDEADGYSPRQPFKTPDGEKEDQNAGLTSPGPQLRQDGASEGEAAFEVGSSARGDHISR